MNIEHRTIGGGEIHTPFNWTVGNTIERSALVVSSDDVGKLCRQTNDNSVWILTGANPHQWSAISSSGGGGGGGPTPVITNPGHTWRHNDATVARIVIPDTGAAGYAAGPGTQCVQLDFISNGYFAANSTGGSKVGHFAVVARCETAVVESEVVGNGAILGFGNAGVFPSAGPRWWPGSQAQTWSGAVSSNLLADSDSYPDRQLEDGVNYRLMIFSTRDADGLYYVRYKLLRRDVANSQWMIERDTGDILDDRQSPPGVGFAMSHVFHNTSPAWSFEVSNIRIYWQAAAEPATQVPTLDTRGPVRAYQTPSSGAGPRANMLVQSNEGVFSADGGATALLVQYGNRELRFDSTGMSAYGPLRLDSPLSSATVDALRMQHGSTEIAVAASGIELVGSLKLDGASATMGNFTGYSLIFTGERWRSGSFDTDVFPTDIGTCADEIVGLKRVLAAIYDDLRARRII